MSDKVERALTENEWAAQQERIRQLPERIGWAVAEVDSYGDLDRHGLAALCLHGMPFGFAHQDVDLINSLIQALDRAETAQQLLVEFTVIHPEPWKNLAARIAALLPPEVPHGQ